MPEGCCEMPASERAATLFLVLSTLDMFCVGLVKPLMPSLLRSSDLGATAYSALQSATQAAGLLSSLAFGRMSDLAGRKVALAACAVISLLGSGCFCMAHAVTGIRLAACGRVLTHIGHASSMGPLNAGLAEHVAKDRAAGLSKLMGFYGLGYSAGSAVGGRLSKHDGSTALLLALLLNVVNMLVVAFLPSATPKTPPPPLSAPSSQHPPSPSPPTPPSSRSRRPSTGPRQPSRSLPRRRRPAADTQAEASVPAPVSATAAVQPAAAPTAPPLRSSSGPSSLAIVLSLSRSTRGLFGLQMLAAVAFHLYQGTMDLYLKDGLGYSSEARGYLLSYAGLVFAAQNLLVVPGLVRWLQPRPPPDEARKGAGAAGGAAGGVHGHASSLRLAFACVGIGRLGLAAATWLPPTSTIVASYLVCNLGQGLLATLFKALVAAAEPPGRLGYLMSLLDGSRALAGVAVPLASGVLYDRLGPAAPATAAGLVCLGATLAVAPALGGRERRVKRE